MTDRRRDTDDLIPWLVNGTLGQAQADAVRRRLEADDRLAGETAWLTAVSDCLRQASQRELKGFEAVHDEAGAYERLEACLGAASASGGAKEKRGAPWWLVAGQAAAILILLGWQVLAPSSLPQSVPSDRILTRASSAAAAHDSEHRLRIVFDERATEEALRELLLESKARIVSGPSVRGVYTIVTAEPIDAAAGRALLEELRSDSRVRFVEPVAGADQSAGAEPARSGSSSAE